MKLVCPTSIDLTCLNYFLFVDQTGCNTNQLNDGKVGGELFIMPKNSGEAAAPTGRGGMATATTECFPKMNTHKGSGSYYTWIS
jgi:hypothetical protein